MKKYLTSLFLILPGITFAQSYEGASSFVGLLLGLAITIGLFFLFRGIMLWYWKIDTIIKNQEETNRLLQFIAKSLDGKDDHIDIED